MGTSHDPIRHLKYLRHSLSQDNEAIGFFVAAGCPLSISLPESDWPLIPDVMGLTKCINERLKDTPEYNTLLSELAKATRIQHKNIEHILSFVRSLYLVSEGGDVRGLNEQQLSQLEKTICEEIAKKIDVELPPLDTPYHRLCNWINSIDRKSAVEIFTTNYDLLLEQALESTQMPYFDGFVGSRKSFFDLRAVEENLIPNHWTRLWKIHGSINWYFEDEGSKKRVHRSSETKDRVSHLIYPSHLKYEESRKMPYLALIDQLSRFIRKKSSLLILCGYSFNDGHINDTILNALKANPTAMVLGLIYENYKILDSSNEPVDRYPEAYLMAKNQHNLNIWTYDKAIIGTSLGDWKYDWLKETPDADLIEFVYKDVRKDLPDRDLIKLGDFSIFTYFLQKIIGTAKAARHV
ncbi:hypothetical protein ABH909_003028 [Pseudomonas sp. BS3782 TE3695]|uniref:SIR2 family protein n=1 Tax=Pseudomonas sp. BS3782 TE3695 TaxID=3349323 RepID=UPI003D2538A0